MYIYIHTHTHIHTCIHMYICALIIYPNNIYIYKRKISIGQDKAATHANGDAACGKRRRFGAT